MAEPGCEEEDHLNRAVPKLCIPIDSGSKITCREVLAQRTIKVYGVLGTGAETTDARHDGRTVIYDQSFCRPSFCHGVCFQ